MFRINNIIPKTMFYNGTTPKAVYQGDEMVWSCHTIYGFHVDSSISSPSDAVTYLFDATGLTPAHMDYTSGTFNYGSWRNAFFMPRPCMLKFDGTVAYYLDENDYSKKADGTASDVSDESFGGNAMMEWGRDGKKIWYKIVADANSEDRSSYSVYFADGQADAGFRCWNFYDKNNTVKDHFYTPIYTGYLDANNRLRSLSGKASVQSKTGTQEIEYAQANGEGWHIETWCDKLVMFMLLWLMGKSLDVQTTYGQGHSTGGSATALINTGALDDKGLFFGYSDTTHKVKVFGMEDQWGNQYRRTAGLMSNTGVIKYKLTEGTADGSTATTYQTTATDGMLNGGSLLSGGGYATKYAVVGDTILPLARGGSKSTYYCDYASVSTSGVLFAFLGGSSGVESLCGFCVYLGRSVSNASWTLAAAVSYK